MIIFILIIFSTLRRQFQLTQYFDYTREEAFPPCSCFPIVGSSPHLSFLPLIFKTDAILLKELG